MWKCIRLLASILIAAMPGLFVSGGVQPVAAQEPEWQEFQSIPTNGARDGEFFTIGSNHYLAMANQYNDSTYNVASKLYRWDANFVEFQSIATNGACDWEFFTIGSDHYLAVANEYNGSTHNLDSKFYRWDGISFVAFQSIPTNGGRDWEFFTIGSDHYLAIASFWCKTSLIASR